MKFLLEVHRYAPEMNTLYRKVQDRWVVLAKAGSSMGKKAFKTIREYRENIAPVKACIVATITTHYPQELKWLERTYSGRVANRHDALRFAAEQRSKLAPGGSVRVSTRIVGY